MSFTSIFTTILNQAPITRFVAHLRDPLYRNGYALVFSSVATSGLGLAYWIVAARTYSTDTVGLNSAAISAMIFLAFISQLNLMNVLNRFLPNATRAVAGRMIAYSYFVSQVLAIASSLVFILGVKIWAPKLGFLGSNPTFILWFTGATMMWCIFVLQDSALTGLRQAIWVPLENILFAVAKIGLLILFVALSPLYGVLASWTIAVALAVIPTNLFIFGKLLPRHVGSNGDQTDSIKLSQILKYVAGDYFGSLVPMAVESLLPIIIVAKIGATANAYFSLSWTIAYALFLIIRNMGMSFIAEVSADQSKLNKVSRRLFLNTARMVVPLVAFIVLGAPYILRLFGTNYSFEGATLLRLLCLTALPDMVVSLYISIVRIQRRVFTLFFILVIPKVLVFVLSYWLMGIYGVNGVGIAWLLSESLAAVFLLATEFRSMWFNKT